MFGLAEAAASTATAVALTAWVLLCVVGWLAFDVRDVTLVGPAPQLAWIGCATAAALAATGIADPVSGRLARWYRDLPFSFVDSVGIDAALLTLAVVLVLLATSNRIVRLVLAAAGTLKLKESPSLQGGWLLGPMERLIVLAVLLAGQPTAAAIIITAKGLLRLPEIRDDPSATSDSAAEYLLIGTFASLMLGAAGAILTSAAGL